MIQISNEEVLKINEFINGCNEIINGKFILADIKISKMLNIIANSEELYRYISECMVGFDFAKELHSAEMKNSFNRSGFVAPENPEKLVAFTFCFLVECDAKRIDFYTFIQENFISKDRSLVYSKFANTLLVPFRDIIASHFGLNDYSNEQYKQLEESYKTELEQSSFFDNENKFNENNNKEDNSIHEEETDLNSSAMQNQILQNSTTMQNNDTWNKIPEICDNIKDCIALQRHLNSYLKDELNYIIDTIKYSVKYKDPQITSALITAFDEMSKKLRQVQFVFGELKNEMMNLYK